MSNPTVICTKCNTVCPADMIVDGGCKWCINKSKRLYRSGIVTTDYVEELEERVAKSEEHVEKLYEIIEHLEERLDDYEEIRRIATDLEEGYRRLYNKVECLRRGEDFIDGGD